MPTLNEPAVIAPLTVATPVTTSCVPSNVRLPLSSSSPPVPARTTRPEVKSSTFAVDASIPLFASIAPEKVATPVGPIVSLSVPPVSTLNVSAVGNAIVVSGSPMCLIALAISILLPWNVETPVVLT